MKPYPKYRDSGVELIGDVPEHWEVKKIKYHAFFQKGKNPKELRDSPGKNSMIYLAMDYLRESPKQIYYVESHEDFIKVDDGEILLLWDGSNAGEFVISKKGVLSSTMAVLRVRGIQKIFCWYSFKNFEIYLKESTVGMGIPHVNSDELKNGFLPVPSITEQTAIAAFLDLKTAEIDSIIAKKERLIELYEEEKAAVINHAVTKGLDPAAKMKDSGIEWLGGIPEHWEVKRICSLFSESSARASSDDETQYPVLSVSIHDGISDKELDENEMDRKVTRSEDKSLYKIVHYNHLAYNMMRAWQGGFGASRLSGLVSPAYVVCRPKTDIDSYFFELILRTPNAITEMKRFSKGIVDFRLRLYWDDFRNIVVPVPPVKEIVRILNHIETKCSRIDAIISKFKRQIELLKEYRTALISEAVTGKIDVRENMHN